MKEANKTGRKRLIADVVLVLCLLLFSLILFFAFRVGGEGNAVRVYVGDELVAEYPLSENGEFPLGDGGNVLKIENGEAYMIYSDCPDHLCERAGKVSLSGERIVCLPNRVIVEVVYDGSFDFVA